MGWTIVGIVLGVLGLLASLMGSILAYFTYVDPRKRLISYLRKEHNWERISTTLGGSDEIWRYKKHPEFVVEVKDDSRAWDQGAIEPWMTMSLPDKNKSVYMVHATVSGVVLYAEQFIALDGWRYFVPIPRIKMDERIDLGEADEEDKRKFFYDEVQVLLAKLIGKLHGDKSIEEFAKHSNIALLGGKK